MAARASFTVQVRGVEPLLATLTGALPARVVEATVATVSASIDRLAARTAQLAPVDTGFMRDHVSAIPSADGLSGEVGWRDAMFRDAGLPFYPPLQEFGWSRGRAQPSLMPAFEEEKALFLADLRAAVGAAVRQERL